MFYVEKASEESGANLEEAKDYYKITEVVIEKDYDGVDYKKVLNSSYVTLAGLEAQIAVIQEKIDLIKGLGV